MTTKHRRPANTKPVAIVLPIALPETQIDGDTIRIPIIGTLSRDGIKLNRRPPTNR